MMRNGSNPSILILFLCSQLLGHLFALEKCAFLSSFQRVFILSKWLGGLPVVIKVINTKSGLLIDNRTCLRGQEAEDISPSPGEGHGSPLWCSCLETPVDREPGRLQSAGL